MSKDKSKKSSRKEKSQAQVTVENLANVTGNAKAAKKALKDGSAKLASEAPKPVIVVSQNTVEGEQPAWGAKLDELREADLRAGMTEKAARVQRQQRVRQLKKGNTVDWNADSLTLENRTPEIVEPKAGVLTAYDKPSKKDKKKAAKLNDVQGEPGLGEQVSRDVLTEGVKRPIGRVGNYYVDNAYPADMDTLDEYSNPVTPEPTEPLAAVTTENTEGPVTPRTRTDNLLVLLRQAQESADYDGVEQTVVCPRKYTTKHYGVQLVKKYAAEGLRLQATEDAFIAPDRDHPKGMWEVTLKVLPNTSRGGAIPTDGKPVEAKLAKGEAVVKTETLDEREIEEVVQKGIAAVRQSESKVKESKAPKSEKGKKKHKK